MKKIKLETEKKSKYQLDRHLISKLGNSLYLNPNVESVIMHIHFKDGSSIGFKKDEEEDEFEDIIDHRTKGD